MNGFIDALFRCLGRIFMALKRFYYIKTKMSCLVMFAYST